jgi:hypothetical protein
MPDGYSAEPKPLKSYATLIGAFNAAAAVGLVLTRDFPERYAAGDVVLLGVATHKFSRLLSKDRVTSALRAPFTRYEHDAGPSEVEESARGQGLQRAIGELVACPYCIGLWVAAAFGYGLVVAPRRTRFVATIGTVLAISDALHHGQHALEEHT